jgi:3-oxocholest-4-en-26-oyl-CoA dehydrogenase alpha subunit
VDFATVELTPDQQAFQQEVRALLDEVVTEEVHEHERRTGDGFSEGVYLTLGARGWLFPEWPVGDEICTLDAIRL